MSECMGCFKETQAKWRGLMVCSVCTHQLKRLRGETKGLNDRALLQRIRQINLDVHNKKCKQAELMPIVGGHGYNYSPDLYYINKRINRTQRQDKALKAWWWWVIRIFSLRRYEKVAGYNALMEK